jgi:hypothetical protein
VGRATGCDEEVETTRKISPRPVPDAGTYLSISHVDRVGLGYGCQQNKTQRQLPPPPSAVVDRKESAGEHQEQDPVSRVSFPRLRRLRGEWLGLK